MMMMMMMSSSSSSSRVKIWEQRRLQLINSCVTAALRESIPREENTTRHVTVGYTFINVTHFTAITLRSCSNVYFSLSKKTKTRNSVLY